MYRLDLWRQQKLHNIFHASLLTSYHETEQYDSNFLEPLPEIIDRHKEHKAEAILNYKISYSHIQYLIKWKKKLLQAKELMRIRVSFEAYTGNSEQI